MPASAAKITEADGDYLMKEQNELPHNGYGGLAFPEEVQAWNNAPDLA